MLGRVAPETLVAVAYAAFVALAAVAVDIVARHSRRQRVSLPADAETGRLRRHVEAALVGFGGLVVLASAALHHTAADLAVLAASFAFSMAVATYLMADLRAGTRLSLDSPLPDGVDPDADQWRPGQSFAGGGRLETPGLSRLDARQVINDEPHVGHFRRR
jgi:hypothetical protein